VRQTLIISGVLCSVLFAFGAGWFFGGFTQAQREVQRRYQHDCELARPLLAEPAFQRLVPFDFPVNGFCLGGPLATQADYERLRAEVTRLFGEPRVGHILADVWVEAAKPVVAPEPQQPHDAGKP
jgi:hypothetical protein